MARADDDQPDRVTARAPAIPIGPAMSAWAVAWVVGGAVLGPLVLVAMGADLGADLTIPQLAGTAGVGWATFLVAIRLASRRSGTGDVVADVVGRAPFVRRVDALAVPAGVLAQLVLIPLLYVPLQSIWPDTFSDDRLEERAQDLVDRAGGATVVLLALVVVVGAPIVEELVYRGLLQRAFVGAVGRWPGLLAASAWFSLIHLAPVEYPGLLLAGLVFGACALVTGRLAPAVLAHAAFNLTGLLVVLASG